ncbi:hypothetical protein INT45_006338 [Circinella minor]|uniref:Uncharacterized protein n=1 Tax=Circinella minor TaxID=1195481 RepID=A0A8H7VI86_9FUNG|nr:hypothetical protein INT45_006338 [Circinella minor]
MVTATQNKLSFNNNKIVIDTDKLQSLLTKHNINVVSFCKETIYEKYDVQFMEKKNKLNIKRKPSEKQKAASKASLKSANTERTTESVRRTIERKVDEEDLKNKFSQENLNSEDKSMKNQDSQDKSPENKDSQESSNPHISDAMLENTSSAATLQGDSDSDDECESGEGDFMCMIAYRPYMNILYETYGCNFVDTLISKLDKEKAKYKKFFKNFFEYSLNTSIAVKNGDKELVDHISKLRANRTPLFHPNWI